MKSDGERRGCFASRLASSLSCVVMFFYEGTVLAQESARDVSSFACVCSDGGCWDWRQE